MTSPALQPSPILSAPFRFIAAIRRAALYLGSVWSTAGSRREVKHLLDLDDRMLRDIGLLRSDVVGALAEPLDQDPSVRLCLRTGEQPLRQRPRKAQMRRLKARLPAGDKAAA